MSVRQAPTSFVASAPGKLVLSGEYAVLEGAPAIVAAVQTRATVRFAMTTDPAVVPPEVRATRRLVEAELGGVSGELVIDVRSLRAGEHKLGVGSSAAASVATAAIVAWAHGLDAERARERIFGWAIAGHAEVAPRGSGVDVAASTFGGLRRCVRTEHGLTSSPLELPAALHVSVVFTGSSARTSDLLAQVHALRDRDAARHAACMQALHAGAHALSNAFAASDVARVLEGAQAYHDAMAELGRAANAPIVEERLRAIAALATAHGGAAKPSGAGGGDVAIAFFDSPDARTHFEEASRDRGFVVVDAALGGEGVTVRQNQ